MTNCMRSGDASFINQWKFKLRISPIPPVNMDQLWTTSEILLRPNRQKSLHYLAIVTSYPIKSSHDILLNLREFVKWSRKHNSMRKIDTNNDIFLAAMLRSESLGRDSTDRKCLHGVHPFYGTGPELLHILKLMSSWIQTCFCRIKWMTSYAKHQIKHTPTSLLSKLTLAYHVGPQTSMHMQRKSGIP